MLNRYSLSSFAGSEALRKITVRRGDSIIELELSDEEVHSLLSLSQKSKKIQKQDIQQKAITKKVKNEPLTKESTLSLPSDEWELLLQSDAEIRGRKDQSKYYLYRSRSDGDLNGIIKSKSHSSKIKLGNPNDASSPISTIMKAVNAMSLYSTFTRRSVSESLPSSLTRGHIMKFAFEYMEYRRLMTKLKEREIGGALMYSRISQDSSSNKVGSEAEAAIFNTTDS